MWRRVLVSVVGLSPTALLTQQHLDSVVVSAKYDRFRDSTVVLSQTKVLLAMTRRADSVGGAELSVVFSMAYPGRTVTAASARAHIGVGRRMFGRSEDRVGRLYSQEAQLDLLGDNGV